jgi:competence protein ComEA
MNKLLVCAVVGMLSVSGFSYAQTAQTPTANGWGAKTAAPTAAQTSPRAGELIDINSASVEQLDTLPGIGEARAKAIVKGRPYKGKNELLDKSIIPSSVYNNIKDRIIAKRN